MDELDQEAFEREVDRRVVAAGWPLPAPSLMDSWRRSLVWHHYAVQYANELASSPA